MEREKCSLRIPGNASRHHQHHLQVKLLDHLMRLQLSSSQVHPHQSLPELLMA